MQRILLTGGAGFIGCNTALVLLEKGFDVIIFDSFINSSEESIHRLEKVILLKKGLLKGDLKVIKGDLRNKDLLENIFVKSMKENKKISGVIHLAGLKAVGESVIKPLNYWDSNVYSTINLLRIMDKYSCKTIIFSSSATIYGEVNDNLIDENSLVNPINPYGNTKATIERILEDLFKSNPNEWRISCLRYFNPIGAHPSGMLGEDPCERPNNIFPLITGVAIGRYKRLSVFGDDWNTKDGTGVRDYIHVYDLAEGHVLTLEHLLKNKPKILNLNLGTGKSTSVLDLINTFEKVNDVKVPYDFVSRRPGDVACVVANNAKATLILDWQPKRSISEMCRDGWKWELNKNKFL
tara:strand:+ start:1689 stop:2741 length:1053 start_codon:yes stop_codon:yes gene_type:complete